MSIEARTTRGGERRYDVRLRRPDGSVYNRTFRTRRDAEVFERADRSARDRGTWVDVRGATTTLGDYAAKWLIARTVRGLPWQSGPTRVTNTCWTATSSRRLGRCPSGS